MATRTRRKTETKSESNGASEVKQGEVVDEKPEAPARPDMSLAVRQPERAMVATDWTPRFAMTVDQAVEMVEMKRDFFKRVMKEGTHYGRIPGMPRDAKPALFKAGAELLCASMQLHPEMSDAEPPMRDYTGEFHGGEPFWAFRRVCRIYRQTGPGVDDKMLCAKAEGSTNSWEKKYRYRESQRSCPECKQTTLIRGKKEWGGGWVCVKKNGGCGAKFPINDERITTQEVGIIKNPDVFEQENTGLKIADKRAYVATTLLATGCGDIFTQDLAEDAEDAAETGEYSGPGGDLSDFKDAPPPATKKEEPKGELSAAQKKILTDLGNSLGTPEKPHRWMPAKYGERIKAVGAKGTLAELIAEHDSHMKDGQRCAHVKAALEAVAKLSAPEPATA
jgi:hypothetical protein